MGTDYLLMSTTPDGQDGIMCWQHTQTAKHNRLHLLDEVHLRKPSPIQDTSKRFILILSGNTQRPPTLGPQHSATILLGHECVWGFHHWDVQMLLHHKWHLPTQSRREPSITPSPQKQVLPWRWRWDESLPETVWNMPFLVNHPVDIPQSWYPRHQVSFHNVCCNTTVPVVVFRVGKHQPGQW
jgi:hypothetical protein